MTCNYLGIDTYLQRLPLLIIVVTSGHAYLYFTEKIPNGENVPHPCKPNYMWKGVGHKNKNGGGERNPFGLDFYNQGKVWSESLCRMDSDGDGRTNGEELGDPNCLWMEGKIPDSVTGITHPGVCEPMNSTFCKQRNDWVDCSSESFQCDALKQDPELRNITFQFPRTVVPAKETNYFCMSFEFPQDGDYHMIATEPIIDNAHVMHHILLFGCTQKSSVSMDKPEHCGMSVGDCFDIIGLWTVGASGECFHRDIGFRLGQHGYKYFVLQIHWNNPQKKSNYFDGSGMVLHYTPSKRIADAGILTIGQGYFEIPPQREEVIVTGHCENIAMNGSIYFTRALNHMHYLGRKMKIEQFRGGEKIRYITNEDNYNYDSPVITEYLSPLELKAGDTLKTTCTFKSTSRTKTVFYGDGTNDEMCLGFLTYYPKQNMDQPFCVSHRNLDQMQLFISQEYRGCRHWDFLLSQSEEVRNIKFKVIDNCRPLRGCLSECLSVVKTVRNHACLKKDVGHWIKNHALYSLDQRVNRTEMTQFYMGISSCDKELEQIENKFSSSGNSVSISLFSLFYCVLHGLFMSENVYFN
ncbi:DBH-like monooxygenase protein 1 [Saccostrea echinata]|uniref:DBH-like monooxygenase protein 1 n=1 Tax=Saccostrea echinata TaxID=191078 RepID=UPI002A7F83B4|nr:DBH-like monooxygenase protein 1 [Saccostrea echinata]